MKNLTCNVILDGTMKEVNLKGAPKFPVAIYNDDLKAFSVPYHWHNEIEIIVVMTGQMELIVELEKYVLKAGEGIFINSGRLHSCTNYDDTNCTIKSMVFHSKFLYGDLSSVLYENYFHNLISETSFDTYLLSQKACQLFTNAYDDFKKEEFAYEFSVRENLTKILLHVIKNIENTQKPTDLKTIRQLKRCKTMMDFIHNNFGKEITLLHIAQSANIKESEALRCFKNVLDTSPVKYLKTYRLEKSTFLLKNTTEAIIDIGLSCGFSEMSYFAKSFKEVYGVTPTEYRKNKRV